MSNESLRASELFEILRLKAELLTQGFRLSDSFFDKIKDHPEGKGFSFGRKAGAGPAGGRYFRFPNGSIVNSPLWQGPSKTHRLVIDELLPNNEVKYHTDQSYLAAGGRPYSILPLYLLPIPKYYKEKSKSGVLFQKIALMHGDITLATTINQKCRYWRSGNQCKFCAIELSLNAGATIEEKTGEQIVESIKAARKENPKYAGHLTLTTGTTDTKDKGMKSYYFLVKKITDEFPGLPIHIQIEPFEDDISWYQKLKDVGVTSVGIHLEVLHDDLRKKYCPGKSYLTYNDYLVHWQEAVNVFGISNVDSFVLVGLEPADDVFYSRLEDMIRIGVVPHLTPVRTIQGVEEPLPSIESDIVLDVALKTAELLKKYKVDPRINSAGCVKCRGCSIIVDAYEYIITK